MVQSITQKGVTLTYTYDNCGNIVSISDGNKTISYAYDLLGQLIRANDPYDTTAGAAGTTWLYTYDLGGNIQSKVAYAFTTGSVGAAVKTNTYSYGDSNWKDKLTAFSGKTISYDEIGNPLNDGSLVAFSISCFDVPYKNTIYFLFAVLVLMPFQVLIVPNYFVLRWTNLLNTPWALLLPGFFGPFAVFLIRQYMITIPKSLIEATAIDGGNYWSAFLYVVVPVSKPAIIAASTLLFADIWNMVEQPLALLEDYTLFPLSMSLIDSSKTPGKSAFAAIVLFMIPPSLLYLYYTDDLILGIQLGDLK